MNEYCRGVLEALGWVLDQIEELDGRPGALEELRRRVRAVIEEVVRSSGAGLGKALRPS